MKSLFLVALILLGIYLLPVQAADRKPFLAVFSNPGGPVGGDWEKDKPDLIVTGSSWVDFDTFVDLTKKLAKGREVIVDVECHGSPDDKLLYLDYNAFGYQFTYPCTMGHVMNQIVDKLPNVKCVVMEACYSELVMEGSLYGSGERYKYRSIPFPVYGVGNCSNFNNFVWLEYKYQIRPYFMDLRNTLYDGVSAKADDSHDLETRTAWSLLAAYGF